MLFLTILAFAIWLALALFHGEFWKPLRDTDFPAPEPLQWPSVDIIVPARNEAESLPHTLPSWLEQDYQGPWRVILVDDHSSDDTTNIARAIAAEKGLESKLSVIAAPELPAGWGGKVAAMQAGLSRSAADFVLFTDADIAHPPFNLTRLVSRAVAYRFDLTSLMVKLRTVDLIEKLMIPAFIFFFALLYPFRRANNPSSRIAAAAGGVMLVRRAVLEQAGGLVQIKNALIDDCALARIIKKSGGKLCLTLTHDTFSLRPYPLLQDVHDMVARTAFTQLRYSNALLVGSVLTLSLMFFVPVAALLSGTDIPMFLGGITLGLITILYAPTVLFYRLNPLWAASLPFAAIFYILATLDSARRHAQGRGGLWKGRTESR